MTKRFIGDPPSKPIDGSDHRSVLAMLPEYVMIRILEQQLVLEWQVLEQHLTQCAACRSEADALRALMAESYAGAVLAAPAPPPPDLSFLDEAPVFLIEPVRGAEDLHAHMLQSASEPIVIQFSAALLPRIHVQMAARTGGVRLRYSYEIPPNDAASPAITIEVLVREDQPDYGLVRICVEHPGRSPFEQAGSRVTLQIEDASWSGVTDQNGVVAFHDLRLDRVEHWLITVTAPDASAASR